METFFQRIFTIFSLEYMFTVIVASYFAIKVVDALNGKRIVPTWLKRVITFLVGAISFVLFRSNTEISFQCLVASFFAATFVYDGAIKWLIKKFNIDYRKDADHNKPS